MEAWEKIISLIEQLKPSPVKVLPTSNFFFDLGFDSLSFVAALLEVEQELSITFELGEMHECSVVERLIALSKEKLRRKEHG